MKQLKFKGLNQQDLENKYKSYYFNNYIRDLNGKKIVLKTTDNLDVLFYDSSDTHAYTSRQLNHRAFDFSRARVLNWIKLVIEENCKGKIYKFDDTKYREYFLEDKNYLVILRKKNARTFIFVTHYIIGINCKLLKVKRRFGLVP